jgi:5-methylcytosine-specific restriction endonuclease McrA
MNFIYFVLVEMSFFEEDWRKPVPKTKRDKLLAKQNGKCTRCRKSFAVMRVKPILHHVRKSNQLRSMELLCPNCHSKAHDYKTKSNGWGGKKVVLVRKRFGTKKPVKKEQKKRKKRTSNSKRKRPTKKKRSS